LLKPCNSLVEAMQLKADQAEQECLRTRVITSAQTSQLVSTIDSLEEKLKATIKKADAQLAADQHTIQQLRYRYIHTYIRTHTHTHTQTHTHTHAHTHTCVCVCVYIHIYTCMYTNTHTLSHTQDIASDVCATSGGRSRGSSPRPGQYTLLTLHRSLLTLRRSLLTL